MTALAVIASEVREAVSKETMNNIDKKIISLLAQDIPLVERPFEALASKLGTQEAELIKKLKAYKKSGQMRKLAAVSNHRKIGFKYNAMVVWNIPEDKSEKTGEIMATFNGVSHCYQRSKFQGWKYNLYTMIHGKTKKECFDLAAKIAKKTGFEDNMVLFSSKEYKKTGVKY